MKDYRPAKKRATVTVGESVRILRKLQDMSQNQLTDAPNEEAAKPPGRAPHAQHSA